MAYIEVKNLDYNYPREDKKTLNNLNFSVEKGEFILITGKSGSGKSTLAKCISGTVPYFYGGTIGGKIFLNGKDIRDTNHKERAKEITMVFQDPETQLTMNKVHREIAFGLENVGIDENKIKRRVWESMQYSNLLSIAYRDIVTLSGGEKQKVAITSALSYMPSCIILDEPTSQLDPSAADETSTLIRKINQELGITIIVIEQRIDKWFDFADKIMVLDNGSIKYFGCKDNFYNYGDADVHEFLPVYLKLAKFLKINTMPTCLKEMRKLLKDFSFRKPETKVQKIGEVAVKIDQLICNYEKTEAVKNLNISVENGDFLGILGANGAGKSTVMKAIMGLIKYKGSIKVFGSEVSKVKLKELASFVGYVSQNPNDYLTKDTVYEEIKFTLDNYNIKDYTLIDDILKTMGIYELKEKNPRDLSGGQRQRVAIASIMVLNPKILMLDEPTRGLDWEVKRKLGKTLKILNKKGTTIILITHDMDFAGEFCSKFMLMFNGEKVSEGNAENVLEDGIFYTTTINKLLRNSQKNIFTLKQAQEMLIGDLSRHYESDEEVK
jgi:energy-coupling factor transport system ATP-binding protein